MHCQKSKLYMVLALIAFSLPAALSEPNKLDMMSLREHVDRGNNLMARQQFQQAINEYEECLNIDPMSQIAKDNIVLAHNNWGIAYFRQRKYDDAKREWEQALKMNPYDRNAKNNLSVLKATMAKLGIQPGDSSGQDTQSGQASAAQGGQNPPAGASIAKPNEPKEPPPAAVILTPIPKAQPAPEDNTAVIMTPLGSTSAPAQTSPPPVQQPVTPAPVATYSSPDTAASSSPAPAASSGGSTIEDRLSAIEQKLYGHKQDKMPVLKRLEKIESDTSGQPRKGTIEERIEALRQTYGL